MEYSEILEIRKDLIGKYKVYIKFKSIYDKNIKIFEKEKTKLINAEFKKKYNCEPFIYAYNENSMKEKDDAFIFYIEGIKGIGWVRDDGNWVSYNDEFREYVVESNISIKELKKFCKELSELLNLKVKIYYQHKETEEDIDAIKDSEDILIVYPNAKILKEGEIWFKGWDIADHWVIYELDGEQVITWSTNGHGFGMDYEIFSPFSKADIDEFLQDVLQDPDNNGIDEWIMKNLDLDLEIRW